MKLKDDYITNGEKNVYFREPMSFTMEWDNDCYRTRFSKKGCWIMEFEDEENDIFLCGTGKTQDEAEAELAWSFIMTYRTHALESDERLTIGAQKLKRWFLENVIIEDVE